MPPSPARKPPSQTSSSTPSSTTHSLPIVRVATPSSARREDAERFIEEVRGDDPEMAAKLRIEEREIERAG